MSAAPRILALVGPTGSGKTATAIAVCERIGGEVVGCDAFQLYRGLDIGTAKPTEAERRRVPHHLIDTLDPRTPSTMAGWVRAAEEAVRDIAGRGRVPVVVGGTGLYLRALLRGVLPAPAHDPGLRDRMRRVARRHGPARLHRCLARLDAESAARLAPNDVQRVQRALDLALRGRRTWSARLRAEGTWRDRTERYPALKVGLRADRDASRERLAARVRGFFEAGWVDEVRALLDAGVPADANAFKAIGYREIAGALARGQDPAALAGEIARATARYAKRQRTWFRGEPGVRWLDADDPARVETIVGWWNAGG